MDTAQWPQEIVVKPIDEIVTNTCIKPPLAPPMTAVGGVSGGGAAGVGGAAVDRKAVRPLRDQALNCPRCNSTNTKFCYYNNYSLTQPRYFCKTCRRYWTEGGSLRNIPVGGGSRKNKRSSSSSSSAASKKPFIVGTPQQPQAAITGLSGNHQNPKSTNAHEAQDLNLAFPHGFRNTQNSIPEYLQVPNMKNPLVSSNCSSSSSALELLTGISSTSCSTSAFLTLPSAVHQDPSSVYSTAASGFGLNYPMQEFMRPALVFSLDGGGGGGYGGDRHDSLHLENGPNATAATGGRLLFPFEDLKLPVSSSSTNSGSGCGGGGSGGDGDNRMDHYRRHHHHHHHGSDDDHDQKEQGDQSAGFWTGMLGGGLGGGGSSWQL